MVTVTIRARWDMIIKLGPAFIHNEPKHFDVATIRVVPEIEFPIPGLCNISLRRTRNCPLTAPPWMEHQVDSW